MVAKKEPKKAKTAKKLTKIELAGEANELLTRIEKAEVSCQTARLEVDDAREAYKTAKGCYANAVEELRKLARARKEKHPLFEAAAKPADKKPEELAANGQAASDTPLLDGKPATAPSVNGETDVVVLLQHGATKKNIEALRGGNIDTLGKLQAAIEKHGEWWAKDAGIHGRSRAPVEDAYNAWALAQAQAAEKSEANTAPA